jgi:hypothetical protein
MVGCADGWQVYNSKGVEVTGSEMHVQLDPIARTANLACLSVGNLTVHFMVVADAKRLAQV